MNTPSRLIDFFALEAGEYLARLQSAVYRATETDFAELRAGARGLRGSATMARVNGIARLAGRIESIAEKLSGRQLAFDPALKQALASSVEDLTTLVHAVRTWGAQQEERVRSALDRLDAYGAGDDFGADDAIVPISQLFYSDAGPHLVQVAQTPRTTFEQRLRAGRAPPPEMAPAPAASGGPGTGLRGAALRNALGSSIATMRSLEPAGHEPAAAVVPIQSLLYRGQRAVIRANELRAQIQRATVAPPRDVFAELCDLVELANTE